MIAIQICCLAKAVVKGHKNLHNLVYPVSNLGAADQVLHLLTSERPNVLSLIIRERGLEDYGCNVAEGSFCETSENRIGKIFDFVFPGQLQFRHGKDGENLLKEYNSATWERF